MKTIRVDFSDSDFDRGGTSTYKTLGIPPGLYVVTSFVQINAHPDVADPSVWVQAGASIGSAIVLTTAGSSATSEVIAGGTDIHVVTSVTNPQTTAYVNITPGAYAGVLSATVIVCYAPILVG